MQSNVCEFWKHVLSEEVALVASYHLEFLESLKSGYRYCENCWKKYNLNRVFKRVEKYLGENKAGLRDLNPPEERIKRFNRFPPNKRPRHW